MGTPTESSWPGHTKLPSWKMLQPAQPAPPCLAAEVGGRMTPDALQLAERLLALDPQRRISAKTAVNAAFFKTHPQVHECPWSCTVYRIAHPNRLCKCLDISCVHPQVVAPEQLPPMSFKNVSAAAARAHASERKNSLSFFFCIIAHLTTPFLFFFSEPVFSRVRDEERDEEAEGRNRS